MCNTSTLIFISGVETWVIRPDGTRLDSTYEGYGLDQTFKSITYQILDTAEVCIICYFRQCNLDNTVSEYPRSSTHEVNL